MSRVVDYSYDRPTIARLKSLGTAADPVVGVMRYVSPQSSKNLSLTEYDNLKAVGLAVGLVWEGGSSAALGGQAQGTKDAGAAAAQADALGYPRTAAIYFAVDFDATPSQIPTVLNYLRAAEAELARPLGVYGGYDVITAAGNANVGDFYWQTSAWSGGKLSAYRHLYQHVYNSDTDVNAVVIPNWGQDSVVTPPKPRPPAPAFPLASSQYFGKGGVTSGHHLDVWQAQMAHRGWTITADGAYGPQTANVAHDFQVEKHLAADSLIGPTTWAAAWKAPVT